MATELSARQKLELLRGTTDLSHAKAADIAEIVFKETGEFWAVGDFLASLSTELSDADTEVTVPIWVLQAALAGIVRLVQLELKQSKGKGKYAKVKARRVADRLHLIRTIKTLNLVDEGKSREEAYAIVAGETEGTEFEIKEDAVKKSVATIEKNFAAGDSRYYLPLSPKLRALFGDLGDFDSYEDWPEGNELD